VLALLASGCAVPPPSGHLQPIAPADRFASARTLTAPEGAWPSDNWWKAYGDPQLDALIAEGLQGATDLRVAVARQAAADAVITQARSKLLPTLSLDAQGGVTKQSYRYLFPESFAPKGWPDYGQATVNANWELDFWGKNRAGLAAAKSDAAAAGAEAAAARLSVSAGIAGAYADLAALHAERDAGVNAVTVRRQTLDLTIQRRDQGLENTGAVERARSGLATAQGDLAALDEEIDLGRHRLAALMGAGPDRTVDLARPAVDVRAGLALPVNLPAELIARRPDIIAARDRAQVAAARVKQARAAYLPNVNIMGLIGLQALGVGNLFKSGADYGSVGPAISLPLFEGGRLQGNYRSAHADYDVAVAQYDGTITQALHEIADAATSQRDLTIRLTHAQEAEHAANAAWTVANNRYRGGLATYLDVLAAEDALISARRSVATLQTRAFALDVALTRALGGGYRS
jgi:NodT family efflux transporter outer membrane factor (OMF) lipoprotein